MIHRRTLAAVRSARDALARIEPLLKGRRVRPADQTSVAAMADALVGAVLGDLEKTDEDRHAAQ